MNYMKWNRILALWMALLCLCGFSLGALAEENLLENGDFETLDSRGLPVGWTQDAYRMQEGYTLYTVGENPHSGDHCVSIENVADNDARFAQTVAVEPESLYRLSGWIRSDGIQDMGRGANLSIEGVAVFSESIYATNGWEYIEWYGETGEDQTEVTIFVRLGGYSGETRGKASFDDIQLVKVAEVPGDATAALWFAAPQIQPSAQEKEPQDADAAWPTLLLGGLLLMAFLGLVVLPQTEPAPSLTKPYNKALLPVGLIVALLLRFVVAFFVEGYPVDVNCFLSWGNTMARVGPTQFYQNAGFCDYPPAYLYVLGANSMAASFLQQITEGHILLQQMCRPMVFFKVVPALCDIGSALVVYRMAKQNRFSEKAASLLALLVTYCPMAIINGAAWGQMDSVLCLLVLLVASFALEGKWVLALPIYMLAVLTKPQALMLGFLGLLCMILSWIKKPESRKPILKGVGFALALGVVIVAPFSLHQPWNWLIELYGKTLSSYAYATVNTCNLYYLFDGNWSAIGTPAHGMVTAILTAGCGIWALRLFRTNMDGWDKLELGLAIAFQLFFGFCGLFGASWSLVGAGAMVMAFAVTLPMQLRSRSIQTLPLVGALLFLLLYAVGVKMHERYLFPALFLLVLAYVYQRDVRLLIAFVVLSFTTFLNCSIVLDNALRLGSSMGHLNADTRTLANVLSLVNCAMVPVLFCAADDACRQKTPLNWERILPKHAVVPSSQVCEKQDSSLHWCHLDWLLVLLLTVAYGVVALVNLGSTTAPQHPWKSSTYEETVVVDLGEHQDDFTMLYFGQVSYQNFAVATSDDGERWSDEYPAEMNQGQCFRWKYLTQSYYNDGAPSFTSTPRKLDGRYVRISANQVGLVLNEVIFRDANGVPLTVHHVSQNGANAASPLYSDPALLFDEGNTLQGEPSWYNGTYFDEIYHARTAFEHLNGTAPYETSHPPLGKLFMSLSVAIFGMTPFGWRFAGALTGILMVPCMYLLGKQLTKRTAFAALAAGLLCLDCMHFTQTRIATIDSFPVLFIMSASLFMLRFIQQDLRAPMKKLLPNLAASGLCFGLACASKWIGAYAGIGLAVLYFGKLVVDGKMASGMGEEAKTYFRRALVLCLWCLLFFVAIPVTIYLLSYIPYFAYSTYDSFGAYLKLVFNAQYGMLNYHSTPGLGMDHPFYSPWYEWPFMNRPMYYAMAQYMPSGYSCAIFCFGNPAVWIVSLLGLLYAVWTWVRNHCYQGGRGVPLLHWQAKADNQVPTFLLVSFAAQFLPWVLVPRGTYIYHYFASVPFLILSLAVLLWKLSERAPRLAKESMILFVIVCACYFVLLYPYASGVTTPVAWMDFVEGLRIPHVYH